MTSFVCGRAPSSASFYVQIAKRCIPGSSTFIPPLDILAPRFYDAGATGHRAYSSGAPTSHCNNISSRHAIAFGRGTSVLLPQRRTFATTQTRPGTACVYNPQADENGDEMILEITDRAGKVWVNLHVIKLKPELTFTLLLAPLPDHEEGL